jgi:hypothetical protein
MSQDLTIALVDRPGTLADVFEALGRAGINVDGACGFPCGGEGILHVLVADAARAKQVLEGAGQSVRATRDVITCQVEHRPGAGGALLRRIAAAGVNVDLAYLAENGTVVIGADDLVRAEQAAKGG